MRRKTHQQRDRMCRECGKTFSPEWEHRGAMRDFCTDGCYQDHRDRCEFFEDVFESCLSRVRQIRGGSKVKSVRFDVEGSKGGPVAVGNTKAEYVAEFELAGRRALKRHPQRLQMFTMHFVNGMDKKLILDILKVKDGTFRYWAFEIKQSVGEELERSGIWPHHRYRKNVNAEV